MQAAGGGELAYACFMAWTPQRPTGRARKWLLAGGVVLALLLLGGVGLLGLLPSDEELARRAATELEAALGVPVSVGALHWRLRPSAVVELDDVATGQSQPIVIKKLTAPIDMAALWRKRLKLGRVELDGAVLPQPSLKALHAPAAVPAQAARSQFKVDESPLAALVFRDLIWISRYGTRVVFDGEAAFDAGWRPRSLSLRRPDVQPVADLTLTRQGEQDRWDTRIQIGGGTADGELQLQTLANGQLRLSGKLQPRGIELSSALAALNLHSVIAGRVSGDTTVSASGAGLAGLAQSLHTRTHFTVTRATLLNFDLERAIGSAGKDHDGKTELDSVTGQLDTQNTADGMVLDFSRVRAVSGVLDASGKARIANRQIEAELTVDLVKGLVGVPLRLSGPLAQVSVSVAPGALAGAAVGTAVLPGAGTAIGARIGAALGKLFSPGAAPPKPRQAPGPRH